MAFGRWLVALAMVGAALAASPDSNAVSMWCNQFQNEEIRARCLNLAAEGVLANSMPELFGKRASEPEPEPEPEPAPAPGDGLIVEDCTTDLNRVVYRVTVFATWTEENQPDPDFPSDPDFSPIVAASHSALFNMWLPGATATAGMEALAEEGETDALEQEVLTAVGVGVACALVITDDGIDSPGERSFLISVNAANPFVSLAARLDPSSDWFTGLTLVNLTASTGGFLDTRSLDLFPWDAGTRTGTTYADEGTDLTVPEFITLLAPPLTSPFNSGNPVGQVRFDCVSGCIV